MEEQKSMDNATMAVYVMLFIAAIGAFLIGSFYGSRGDVLISIPIIILMALTMINDKKIIHIPPTLMVLIVVLLYLSLISHIFDGGILLSTIQNILIGVLIGIAGLIVVYVLIGQLPGFDKERPALVSLLVFTFGIAIYALWGMIEFFVLSEFADKIMDIESYMTDLLWVAMGALLISVIFYLGRASVFFNETVIRFLKKNSEAMGLEPALTDAEKIMDVIKKGESERVEFKSTLRTNLVTGEKDKRMEKSVLKTLVAFLNTEGGTLLIGVADDGRITGIDEESFENRDKMNLHMTQLISGQIGKEFLPYIDFIVVNFENVAVMRVDCEPIYKPVFLKDNKEEIYYVRSGPSSVELSGMDLINYVEDRKMKTEKEKKRGIERV